MANIKITELTEATTIDSPDLLFGVQNGQSKKFTVGTLTDEVSAVLAATAPETLNTIAELAEALNDSPAQVDDILTKLGEKAVKANNLSDLTDAAAARTNLSLGNVTNESKATMFTDPTFTGTVSGVTATHVGLGNVTNESKATMFTDPTFTGNATFNSPITIGDGTFDYGDTETDTVIIGDGISVGTSGSENVLIGHNVSSYGVENVIIGDGATGFQGSDQDVIIGKNAHSAYGNDSLAIGNNAHADGDTTISIGKDARAGSSGFGYKSISIGRSAYCGADKCIAIGDDASAGQYQGPATITKNIAIGYVAVAGATSYVPGGSGVGATAIGHRAKTKIPETTEIGFWSNATTRGGAVRIQGGTGQVSMTIQNRSSAYTDGGTTKGSEEDNELMREAYSFRRNSTNLFLDLNVAGSITTKDLGAFASDLAPLDSPTFTGGITFNDTPAGGILRPVVNSESDDTPIRTIRRVTQAQYDALTPDAFTMYVIVG